ncbi:hypothetical protein Fmac_006718 [Flemingia macrophylla]|uniref:RING-type E3 ubiquitin transferase n=1 Tax=Flemingia macrophylla TaxID=520843 RepID=A0ABD1NBF3_9FABA
MPTDSDLVPFDWMILRGNQICPQWQGYGRHRHSPLHRYHHSYSLPHLRPLLPPPPPPPRSHAPHLRRCFRRAAPGPSVLKALPTFSFSAGAGQRAPEDCAVCLSEFNDGDEGRVLPNCGHGFHAHCIDAWFASHSTCPLCRTTVRPEASAGKAEADSVAEGGEGCSSSLQLPAAVACPRKAVPLSVIVEVERGSDPVSGDQGLRWTLKRFCSD